jgi:hypothetical protein
MASTGYVRNKLLWDPMVSVSAKDAFELPKIAATVILEVSRHRNALVNKECRQAASY